MRAVHILKPSVATCACYREGKVGTNRLHRMPDRVLDNYLRAQRKHAGLTQQEIGRLLGYRKPWQVGRHERSQTTPPLLIALAYEVIFQVPVAALFTGMRATAALVTEEKVAALEKDLLTRKSAGHLPMVRAQKLKWLRHRKASK